MGLEQSICLICKEEQPNSIIRLPCKHKYCTDCFTNWYKNNKHVCCYCFTPFNYSDYVKVNYNELPDYQLMNIIDSVAESKNYTILKKINSQIKKKSLIFNYASEAGYLEVVKYLHSIGAKCNKTAMDFASGQGELEVVKYLHETVGVGCTADAMDWASENGHLDVVRYLHEVVGVGCTENTMDWASRNGHLDVVRYLHEVVGVGCTENTMNCASGNGHLEVVVYLHETVGVGCTTFAIESASEYGNLEVVKYLHETVGIPCTLDAIDGAEYYENTEVVQYLLYETVRIGCNKEAINCTNLSGHLEVSPVNRSN